MRRIGVSAPPIASRCCAPPMPLSWSASWWRARRSTPAPVGCSPGSASCRCCSTAWMAARRSGFASAFGARFDLETDAFFVLALSALLYHSGQAGAWVLTAGLMRYTFVAAGWLWSALAAPLPPSRRRKVICVVLILALLTALTPAVG